MSPNSPGDRLLMFRFRSFRNTKHTVGAALGMLDHTRPRTVSFASFTQRLGGLGGSDFHAVNMASSPGFAKRSRLQLPAHRIEPVVVVVIGRALVEPPQP